MDTKHKDTSGLKDESAQGTAAGTGTAAAGTGGTQDPAKFKTGKWATNVEVAVTQTHLLVLLSPDHPLATYPPPPGAPGYVRKSSFSKPTDSSEHAGGTSGGHPSIGRKIIDLFKPGGISKDEAVKEHVIDPTTGQPTAHPETTSPTTTTTSPTTHAEPIPFPAPTPDMVEKSFPAYVGGQRTTYVAVPLAAIKDAELKLVDDKGEIGVRVPITSHFSTFGHTSDTLGKELDEASGRSGKIKFEFDRNWLGAKAEAEVLHHTILQAIENRRNAPPQTLSLGAGFGGSGAAQTGSGVGAGATQTGGGGGGGGVGGGATTQAGTGLAQQTGTTRSGGEAPFLAPPAGSQDMDPLDTSSEAKVAGMAA
jgi:hypothetical protein